MAIRCSLGVAFRIAAVALVAAAVAPPANGGLLATGPADYCDSTASQPFAPWGDDASYVLLPGGAFEPGDPSWKLEGGADVVRGNEPFYVSGPGKRSLFLPTGSSATSPTTCFAFGDWHARFFVSNRGAATASLRVEVIVRSVLGVVTVLDGGTVQAGEAWHPSERAELILCNVTSLVGTKAVAFRFTPVGSGAAFQIDDVYLDPWKSY